MAYKKYIKRKGKVYGPYIYHSRKVKGKVITEYRGKHKPKDKKNLYIITLFGLIIAFFIILILSNSIKMTGFSVSEELEKQELEELAFIDFVIELTDAKHLDSNKNFISNIFEKVKELDDVWSEQISSGEYIRVTFEENLTSENDITIYPRVIEGNPIIKVYEVDENNIIAQFTNLISDQYNKVLLTNLVGEQDVFDLLVLGGSLIIDYIIDPEEFFEDCSLITDWTITGNWVVGAGDVCYCLFDNVGSTMDGTAIDLSASNIEYANLSFDYENVGLDAGVDYLKVYVNNTTSGWVEIFTTAAAGPDSVEINISAHVTLDNGVHIRGTCKAGNKESCSWDNINITSYIAGPTDNPPTTTLNSPIDYDNSTSNSITFNCTGSDDINLVNVSLYGNWSTVWHLNETNSTPTNATPVIFSKTISDGYYVWNCRAGDNSSQYNFATSNRTFTIDSTAPTITLPIYTNATPKKSLDSLTLNISASDSGVGVDSCVVNVATAAASNQTIAYSNGWCNGTYSLAGTSEGNQTINVYANDTLNNWGLNNSYVVWIDNTGPILSNEASNETIINQSESFCLNITASDSPSDISIVYAEVWDTSSWANYSMSDTGSTSCDDGPGDGVYGVKIVGSNVGLWNYSKVYANDSLGNMKSYDFSDLTINVTAPADSTYPQFSDFTVYPNNDTPYSPSALNYKFNSTITFTNATAGIDFGGINYSSTNVSDAHTVSIPSLAAGIYDYFWWSFGNGSNKNPNSSSIRTYSVAKSSDSCSIYFNETSPLAYPGTFLVWTNCTSSYNMYRNGSSIENNSKQVLGAGAYNFSVLRTDSLNYTNYYHEQEFQISKATPTMNYYLNGAQNNVSVDYPGTINTSAYATAGTINLYRNSSTITSENNLDIELAAGYYEYEFNVTGNENYSDVSSSYLYAEINKSDSNCQVLFNETSPLFYGISFKVYTDCDPTFTLYRNGTVIANNSPQNLAASAYNFSVLRTDSSNYTNYYDEQEFRINKTIGEVATHIDNTRNNKSVLLNTEKWLNATLITGHTGSIITLYYNDTLINQGTSPLYNLTNFSSEGVWNISSFYEGNENYTSDYETWWVTVSSDSPPTLTLNSPVDYYNSSSINIQFNCTADDDINIVNVSLYGNWTGNWLLNETNLSPINNAPVIFDKTISDGIYVWNCKACDSISQCSFASANYTFSVDTVYPNFTSYTQNPDPPNEDQNIQVNVTITETNIDKVILEFNNGTATNYTVTTSDGNIYYFNITSGNYTAHDSVTYYWYANDTAGNMNKSSQQSFTVANQIPTITVNEPDGINDDTKTTFNVTWSASDNDAEDSLTISCYGDADNSGYDKTYTCFTGTANDDSENCDVSSWNENTYYIWCNATDTYSSTVDYSPGELTIDKTGPSVGSEIKDKTPNEDQDVQLNATITVTGVGIDTVWVNVSVNNSAETKFIVTPHSGDEYYFTLDKGNYTAHDIVNWTYHANDTLDNLGSGTMQSFTIANQIPTVTQPAINDTNPYTNDLISCNGGTFSDNDAEDTTETSREFKWYDDDVEISGQNSQTLDLSVSGLDKNNVTVCSIRVSDGYDWSSWQNSSNSATIQNSAPTIDNPQTTISWDANGSMYYHNYSATDLDGDSFTWYINTTLLNIDSSTGEISDIPTEAQAGTYAIEINVSDGTVNATDVFTYTINDVTNPSLTIFLPEAIIYSTNESLLLNYTASDPSLDSCWYNIDLAANTTVSSCANTTFNTSGSGSFTLYLYANDSSGNLNNTESVTFEVDLTNPTASLGTNPVNNSNESSQSITFELSCSDNIGVNTLILYGNWTGTWHANQTNTSALNNSVWSIQVDDIPEGTGHVWGVWCNDSVGRFDWSDMNRTFNIDLTNPLISITNPTATNYTTNISELNYTFTETNVDKCWYSTNNGTTNSSTQTCGTNWTDLVSTENYNTWTVYINDTSGNENSSSVTFFKDTIAPYFTILANQTSPVNQSFLYDVDATDDGIGIDAFNLNDTSNFTIDSATGVISNITSLTEEVFYTLNLSVNDSLGNLNWSIFTINITLDSTNPQVSINSPTATTYSTSSITFNITATDNIGISSCWYSIDGGVINTSLSNSADDFYTASATLSNADYVALYWCNDTSNNLNNTENVSFTVSVSAGEPPGGGGRIYECREDTDCEEEYQVCLNHKCVKLFDIKIINFESPVKLGEFFEFTYLVKGMADISGDVEVLFWIEKQGESVTSGSDVIYIGNFEEKIETTKIFLPSTVDSGVYQFFVKINYGGYTVQSHRTIEIEVTEGVAEITPIDKEPSKNYLYYILGILALAILIVLIKIIRRINWRGLSNDLRRSVSRYRLPRDKLPSIDYAKIQRRIELRKKLKKIIESIKILTENSIGYLNNYAKLFKFKIKKKPKREYKPKRFPEKLEVPEPEIKHEPKIPEHLHILKKKYAEEIVEETKKEEPKRLPPAIKAPERVEEIPKKEIQVKEKPKEPMYEPVIEPKEKPEEPEEPMYEPVIKESTEDASHDIIESMAKKEEDKKFEE